MSVRFVTANLNKDLGGDQLQLEHLRALAAERGPGVLCLQELGHGLTSTRLEGVGGVDLRRRRRWVIGRTGVHRGIARGVVRVGRARVRVESVHGLHRRTTGTGPARRFLARFAARINRDRLRVTAGDFNDLVVMVARDLDGQAFGRGIIGLVVSPGLVVVRYGHDDTGKHRGWTDHPAYYVDVEVQR